MTDTSTPGRAALLKLSPGPAQRIVGTLVDPGSLVSVPALEHVQK